MKIRLYIVVLLLFCVNKIIAIDYYADATNGSNDDGDGSSGNPWQTITYAITKISGTGFPLNSKWKRVSSRYISPSLVAQGM